MAKNEAKIKFTAETGEFNDSIKKSNQTMAELRSEMKLNETQMKETGTTVEGLENKQKILSQQHDVAADKVDALTGKLNKAVEIFGENSTEASKLRVQLNNAKTEEEKLRQEVNKCGNELQEQGRQTKTAGEGFTVFKGVLADLASNAIQAAIGKLSGFTSYLKELPSATAEIRADFATLDTSFDKMGFSAEEAEETAKRLFKTIGEDDRSIEASNHIAKISKTQEDLTNWTTIATGVWGQYQDSLPLEGLTEAANETSKVGTLTGVLADALNWAGVNEEDFQEKLDKCNGERERAELIQSTLLDLYSESAATYDENTQSIQAARDAEWELNQVQNELAETIEPVTTEFTNLKTELLEGMQPAIETISDLMLDALDWMRDHPTAVMAISSALGVLAVGLGAMSVAMGIYTIAQWAMNSAILANPITWIVVGIIAAIAALVAIGVVLYRNWDTIKAKAKEMWSDLKRKFSEGKEKVQNTLSDMKTGVLNKIEELKTGAKAKFDALKLAIVNPINDARTKVKDAVDKIKDIFDFEWSIPKPKIPKFSVSGGEAPWGFMDQGKMPKIDIKWNKAGAILTKPTLFGMVGNTLMGGGEAGKEAVLPISVLQDYINNAFDRNVMSYAAAGGGGDVYNFYVDDARINDNEQMRTVAKNFLEEIVRLGGMNK